MLGATRTRTRDNLSWGDCCEGAAREGLQGLGAFEAGSIESPLAPLVMATVDPSSLLRAPDEETRRLETRRFIDDLRALAEHL